MGFNEKLAAAKERGRPSKIVTVALDAEVSDRLASLEDQVEAEKQKPQDGRLAKKSPLTDLLQQVEDVRAEFSDTLVDLKFTRLIGESWSDITLNNPPRDKVLADLYFQYDFNAVTRHAAIESGVLVEDGADRTLTADDWDSLLELISGGDHRRIADAIYALNEGDTARAVEVGKALRAVTAASEKKSS
jgi:hypothetical protein